MADEVEISIKASVDNGLLLDDINTGVVKYNMPTAGAFHRTVGVANGFGNAIAFGEMGSTNKGWLFMQNLGTTDIKIGAAFLGTFFFRLPVDGTQLFHLTSATQVWVATQTSTSTLFYKAWRRSQ